MQTETNSLARQFLPQQGARAAIATLIAFLLLLTGQVVSAGTNLVVTSLSDSGPGSLRQTLGLANLGDKITFAVEGEIVVTNGPLQVTKSIQIVGPCANSLFINGRIIVTSNVFVTISDLTVTNGYTAETSGPEASGGGILNLGNLTLLRCVVVDCTSEFGVGGGIASLGPLTLRDCSVSNNLALSGGGIFIENGRLNLDRTTINFNKAFDTIAAFGGGIMLGRGTALVTNSTISQNITLRGNGGGIWANSYVRFESCTIVSNSAIGFFSGGPTNNLNGRGGGIFSTSVFETRNTIFQGNKSDIGIATPTAIGPDCFGLMFSQGYNLIGNPANCTIAGVLVGNLIGVDPKLGPLQNNGGYAWTHALLPGSPAIDAGSPYVFPPVDERLVVRPQDGNGDGIFITDIGAYEKLTIIPGSVPGNLVVTSLADSGPGTLREAVSNAVPGSKITFAVTGVLTLVDSSLFIDKSITIAGPGERALLITRTNNPGGPSDLSARPILISSNVTVQLFDLTIANGVASFFFGPDCCGGGIFNFGNLTMTRCVVSNCIAEFGIGGGIASAGPLTLKQCTIVNNLSGEAGGGGIVCSGQLVIDSSTIANNAALAPGSVYAPGGGIWAMNTAFITNSTISGNRALQGSGGGLYAGAYARIESCTIVSNTAVGFVPGTSIIGAGGGVYAAAVVEVHNTIIAGNFAHTDGVSGKSSFGPDFFGQMLSQGWNLIQNPTDAVIFGVLTGNLYNVNPLLGPLQDNGGPTPTHALLDGSPAIDAASPFSFPPNDQRGFFRPADGNGDGIPRSDIGSYEKQAPVCTETDHLVTDT